MSAGAALPDGAHPSPRGIGIVLAAAASVGVANVVVRAAMEQGHAPLPFTALAIAMAALLLLPWLRRFPKVAPGDRWRLAAGIVAGSALAPAALAMGLTAATALTAVLLINLELVFTPTLAYLFLGERTPPREAGALALVAAGGLVLGVGSAMGEAGGTSTPMGIALVALAALAFSADHVVSTPLARRYRLKPLQAGRMLVAAVLVGAVAWLVDGQAWSGAASVGYAGGSALLGFAGGMLLFYTGLRMVGATRSVFLFATHGFWGAIVAVLWLGERLAWPHYVGGALMAAGIGALAWASSRRPEARRARRPQRA